MATLIYTLSGISGNPKAATDGIAATIYGEARGESMHCKFAVASVIYNRAKVKGETYIDACLAPNQFCCWNKDQIVIHDDPASLRAWGECFGIAATMRDGIFHPTTEATFFHDRRLSGPPKDWGKVEFVEEIGGLKFYKGVKP